MKLLWLMVHATLLPVSASAQQPTLAVLPAEVDDSAAELPAAIFDDAVLAAVQARGGHQVIGRDDLTVVLGLERQKDLLGCTDVSCMAEIAGALDVELIIALKVARLGEEWTVTSKLILLGQKPRALGRGTEFVAGDANALVKAVPRIIASLFESQRDEKSEAPPAQPAEPLNALTPPLEEEAAWPAARITQYVAGPLAIVAAALVVVFHIQAADKDEEFERLKRAGMGSGVTAQDANDAGDAAEAAYLRRNISMTTALALGSVWGICWAF